MTLDKSLKRRGRTSAARSVLTRDERLAQLKDSDRWQEGDSVLGLPKVRVYKMVLKKKKKKEEGADAAKPDAKKTDTKKAEAKKPAPKGKK